MINEEPATEVMTPEVKKPEVKLQYKIETQNGQYTVRRPIGRVGVVHFGLVARSVPTGVDENGRSIVSPADQDRFMQCFDEWTVKVLPLIFIDGPTKPEEMPGEDQYALFIAMLQVVNMQGGSDLFRFVD